MSTQKYVFIYLHCNILRLLHGGGRSMVISYDVDTVVHMTVYQPVIKTFAKNVIKPCTQTVYRNVVFRYLQLLVF